MSKRENFGLFPPPPNIHCSFEPRGLTRKEGYIRTTIMKKTTRMRFNFFRFLRTFSHVSWGVVLTIFFSVIAYKLCVDILTERCVNLVTFRNIVSILCSETLHITTVYLYDDTGDTWLRTNCDGVEPEVCYRAIIATRRPFLFEWSTGYLTELGLRDIRNFLFAVFVEGR